MALRNVQTQARGGTVPRRKLANVPSRKIVSFDRLWGFQGSADRVRARHAFRHDPPLHGAPLHHSQLQRMERYMNTHGTTSAPKMQHESGYLAGNFVLPTLSLRVGVLYRIFSHRQSVGSGASCIYMLCQRIARTKFNILTVILR
jgi:hypothetical protein